MSTRKFKFSGSKLLAIHTPKAGRVEYYDSVQHGLCLRVTSKGKKTFRLNVWDRNKKRPVRETIGEWPVISINDARKIVSKRVTEITEGVDVEERRRQQREEEILNDIFNIWLETHAKPNLKGWEEEKRRYELYIKPYLGYKRLSEITPDAIRRTKVRLLKQKKRFREGTLSPGMVGRVMITLSSIFGKTVPHMVNPCSQVEKIKPRTRKIFLKASHLNKFFQALEHKDTPEILKDYCLLSLYTGARQANVLAMRWQDVDLGLKLWIIPAEETKGKKGEEQAIVVPLLDQAIEVLERRKKNRSSIFVLPTPRKSKTGHYVEPKKGWYKLLERAGLGKNIIMHDLRRTMGSWQAITGSSTKIIGASLGHKSEQATAHYAHLTIEPVRDAMQRAADEMDRQKDVKKIVEIKK